MPTHHRWETQFSSGHHGAQWCFYCNSHPFLNSCFLGTKDIRLQARWPQLTPGIELIKKELQITWNVDVFPPHSPFLKFQSALEPTHTRWIDSLQLSRSPEQQFAVVKARTVSLGDVIIFVFLSFKSESRNPKCTPWSKFENWVCAQSGQTLVKPGEARLVYLNILTWNKQWMMHPLLLSTPT